MATTDYDEISVDPWMGTMVFRPDFGVPDNRTPTFDVETREMLTSNRNLPNGMAPRQWQNFDSDYELTAAIGVYDNNGGALVNFADENFVNGSFGGLFADFMVNSNGLQRETNPDDYFPYLHHDAPNPNGFTEALNYSTEPMEQVNTSQAWTNSLYDNLA